MIALSKADAAAVYSSLVPGYRVDRRRYSTQYRGGNSSDALCIDVSRGWYDHVRGEGGDVISFVMRATGLNFKDATQSISGIIGRDISHSCQQDRSRSTQIDLVWGDLLRTGLLWRIERALATSKGELWGAHHKQVAAAVRTLTRMQTEVNSWSPRLSAEALSLLSPSFVRECIDEAQEAYDLLAAVICSPAMSRRHNAIT